MTSERSGASRYDEKAVYQRNVIWGGVVTYVPLLLVIAWSLFADRLTSRRQFVIAGDGYPTAREVPGGNGQPEGGPCSSRNEPMRRNYERSLGRLPRIVVVRDAVTPSMENKLPGPGGGSDLPPDMAVDLEESPQGGGGEGLFGSGTGDGLPQGPPFMPHVNFDRDMGRYIDSILLSESAVVRLAEPRWPILAKASDTGYVTVLFTLYADGTISGWNDFEVLQEIPEGKGFAHNVKLAICFRSQFEPRLLVGEPVNTVIQLSVMMCRECDSYVGSLNNLVAVSKI